MKLLEKLCREEWTIAYRKREDRLLFERDGRSNSFTPLKNTLRYWCADPFLIAWGGREYLFFERYDRLKRKGVIAYREEHNGKWEKAINAIELDVHLSYPFVFVYKNDLYIVPESNQLHRTVLFKCIETEPTLSFEMVKPIIDDASIADATFLEWKGNIYCFASLVEKASAWESLLCWRRLDNGSWVKTGNLAVRGAERSRMGGAFFRHGSDTIRVSQNCCGGYGRGINFSVVDSCGDSYREHILVSLFPNDVRIKGAEGADGIHTYNLDDKYEVIDFVYDKTIHLFDLFGRLIKRWERR